MFAEVPVLFHTIEFRTVTFDDDCTPPHDPVFAAFPTTVTLTSVHCAFCRGELGYVHGHAACLRSGCPMFGVNQAECCSGETAACGPLTADVTRGPATPVVECGMGPARRPVRR